MNYHVDPELIEKWAHAYLRDVRSRVIARLGRYIQHEATCESLHRGWRGNVGPCDCGVYERIEAARNGT